MERVYTVLPDGSVFWLNSSHDYIEAAQIRQDEAGDANNGALNARPLISTAVSDD